MPTYVLKARNGQEVEATGDHYPTDAEKLEIFKAAGIDTNWMDEHPTTAALAEGVVNTLPAAGAIAGGAIATPETLGTGTVAGAALGAGVGRGLRDLIAHTIGLESTTPTQKAKNIALDTTETAAAQAILPGLVTALSTPGQTVKEALNTFQKNLPRALRVFLPEMSSLSKEVANKPAQILSRPAWQTWQEYAQPMAEADKPYFKNMQVLQIRRLMEQGVPQGEAVRTVMNLKVMAPK